jgi:hypothetical protein
MITGTSRGYFIRTVTCSGTLAYGIIVHIKVTHNAAHFSIFTGVAHRAHRRLNTGSIQLNFTLYLTGVANRT